VARRKIIIAATVAGTVALLVALDQRAGKRGETAWRNLAGDLESAEAWWLPRLDLDASNPPSVRMLDARWEPVGPDSPGLRSEGPAASLLVPGIPADAKLSLEVEPRWTAGATPRSARILVNGKPFQEFDAATSVRREMVVPASFWIRGTNEVEIRCDGAESFRLASLHLAPKAPREDDAAGRLPRGAKRRGDDIVQAPGAHLAFCFVPPDGASLVFAIGPGPRPVRRRVAVEADGKPRRVLFDEPASEARTIRLPLTSFAGSPACLDFEAEPGSGPPSDELATWRSPRIVVPADAPRRRPPPPSPGPPNVVLYIIDTLRADHLQAYGYPRPTSPRIDGLAREGLTFERAYAHSVWTKPSVGSLLTGRLPDEHGAIDDVARLGPDVPQIATLLRRAGYRTFGFQANGGVGRLFGFDRDYDYFLGSPDLWEGLDKHQVSTVGSRIVHEKILAQADRLREPFFLLVQTGDPHSPYEPRDPFRTFVKGSPFDGLGWAEGLARWSAASFHRQGEEYRLLQEYMVGLYDGEIRHNDLQFGRLLDFLKQRGVYDRTAVFLTADHGEDQTDRGPEVGHGTTFWEHVARVPLIFKPPGRTRAARVATPVQHVDVLPTILDMAGQGRPDGLAGDSLFDAAGGLLGPRPIRISRFRDREIRRLEWEGRAVIVGPWKLIHDDVRRARYALYDLARDPRESDNLWDPREPQAPVAFRALHAELIRRPAGPAAAPPPATLPESLREELRALGYVR
jgi:arylsulfatase A-like enzyme